jgi:secondary thiamine-phosphate synthase enzyme
MMGVKDLGTMEETGEMVTHTVKTGRRKEMIDITALVRQAAAGVSQGLAVVYVPHTTAGVTVNENADPDVCRDLLAQLEQLAPADGRYRHTEGNSDAHVQASLVGSSVTLIVAGGALVLGTWQSVFFCEFDGPRSRKVHLEIIPK